MLKGVKIIFFSEIFMIYLIQDKTLTSWKNHFIGHVSHIVTLIEKPRIWKFFVFSLSFFNPLFDNFLCQRHKGD